MLSNCDYLARGDYGLLRSLTFIFLFDRATFRLFRMTEKCHPLCFNLVEKPQKLFHFFVLFFIHFEAIRNVSADASPSHTLHVHFKVSWLFPLQFTIFIHLKIERQ